MIFDLLRNEGASVMHQPHVERRRLLERLDLDGDWWSTPDNFADGRELYQAVCEWGLEGVVAKLNSSTYRPGERGWVKCKNPAYWRRESERESMKQATERRHVRATS
jgi:bifunctional non-homologous end joining protein LigD